MASTCSQLLYFISISFPFPACTSLSCLRDKAQSNTSSCFTSFNQPLEGHQNDKFLRCLRNLCQICLQMSLCRKRSKHQPGQQKQQAYQLCQLHQHFIGNCGRTSHRSNIQVQIPSWCNVNSTALVDLSQLILAGGLDM